MTKGKEFGGDLISMGKNTEATGGGAANIEDKITHVLSGLEKTTHLHFTIEGECSDQVDWFDWIGTALEGENARIIHGNVNTYYTEKKEVKKNNDGTGNKPK